MSVELFYKFIYEFEVAGRICMFNTSFGDVNLFNLYFFEKKNIRAL